ncbi:MAG: tRNA-binding protein, partial [Chitinophagales bacterium]
QITDYYNTEALIGKQIVAVLNFPVKQIANFFSECLVLGAVEDDGKVVLLHPGQKTQNGTRIG